MKILQLNDLSFKYDNSQNYIFKNTNLSFKSSTLSILYGDSGCGKSTLLKVMAGFYPKYDNGTVNGQIIINTTNINNFTEQQMRTKVAMMFQNPNQQFCMKNGYDEFIFTLENMQLNHSEIIDRIKRATNFCKINEILHQPIEELSGGEKQRLALAIIYAIDSDIIFLDEPFASIDQEARQQLIIQLNNLKKLGKTIIIIDHDLSNYNDIVDNIISFDESNSSFKFLNINQHKLLINKFEQKINLTCKLPKNNESILKIKNVSINNGNKEILKNVNTTLYKNKTTLLTGKNGVGKSTLMNVLIKMHQFKGQIILNNKDIGKIKSRKYYQEIGIVFQENDRQFFKMTVKDEINLSLKKTKNMIFSKAEINQFINKLGLNKLYQQVVYSLSDGQKKRLQIIVMIIMGQSVLLLDEPFKGIDLKNIELIIGILKLAKKRGQTQIIISHQLFELQSLIDFHLTLRNKNLIYQEDVK
ncbi:energy-coupling factor ABC transporter ATP-binding protein [Apilactobacillus apisilvae]|uniref:Energy-coupling factor ABC transporter ATP-binding protein n=1 Tax=Apilactobacillus apisilvae TaxID=2923364 RepID=A0ABY4PFI1_9LACO|nr:ABC transporter ATP-binding protein [Apilactobacillus apisilvae]UQS84413.1 energy-coupling factor ABC transporter ATP-binding protein [Apilactobacillus apisilvae]